MWQRDGRKSEEHLSCAQRLEQRRGFREVGKAEGWCSFVGLMAVAETETETEAWVPMGGGRKAALTLVLVAEVEVGEEEKEEPLER